MAMGLSLPTLSVSINLHQKSHTALFNLHVSFTGTDRNLDRSLLSRETFTQEEN